MMSSIFSQAKRVKFEMGTDNSRRAEKSLFFFVIWTEKPEVFKTNKMRFSKSQQFTEGMYLKKLKKRRYSMSVLEAKCSTFHFLRYNFYNANSYILCFLI